ncbi:MAG: hypothetical protein ACLTQI_05030, partial [Slackia sp.]
PLNSSILVIYYTGEKAAGQSESLGSVKKSQVEKWTKKREEAVHSASSRKIPGRSSTKPIKPVENQRV